MRPLREPRRPTAPAARPRILRRAARLAAFAALAALVAATGVSLSPAPARAGGFLVYDVSAAATGQASAVVAGTAEPAAVWYNPAAIASLPGVQASLGTVVVTADTSFSPAAGGPDVSTEAQVHALPHAFVTVGITDWLAAGVGVLSPFGLGNRWPDQWVGRESSIESEIVTVLLNPTISIRIHELVSLGFGFDVVRGAVDLTYGLPEPVGGRVRIGGTGWGYGGNVGLLVRPLPERLHVGFTWRSRVALPFDGRADFDPRPEFARDLPDQGGRSDVTLPDLFALGVMGRPIPSLALEVDANLVLWDTYDETVLRLAEGERLVLEHHYEPSWVVRLGADWETPLAGLHVRGGIIWDQSPAPPEYLDPSLPDSDQIDVCLGLGYRWRWTAVALRSDFAYQLIVFLPADATTGVVGPEGTYRTLGHFFALTLTVAVGPTQ